MRAYSAADEEAVRTRELLQDWRSEGLLSPEQYGRMEQDTVCGLRRTNIFLRLVLFFFTVVIAGAAVGLFAMGFSQAGERALGVFLLICAAAAYAGAEIAVSNYQLYRHGIEEALVVCSVGLLCLGMALLGGDGALVWAAGAVASLWIWHRFGLAYAFFAAVIFAAFVPGHWTAAASGQHLIVGGMYAAGLALVFALRLDSIAEALLWLGIYVAINLQLSSDLLDAWVAGSAGTGEFSRPFYWTTYVLTWCLPPVMLVRGVRSRGRWVIAAGLIAAVLTLITNKPYLGWPRHTWDPMLLGALLAGVALFVQKWLGKGAGGVRHGFTARRLSANDKSWMNVGITVVGLASPEMVTPKPQASSRAQFGGGDSGGGGATSDF